MKYQYRLEILFDAGKSPREIKKFEMKTVNRDNHNAEIPKDLIKPILELVLNKVNKRLEGP